MIFRNDNHGVLFEKEIRYHKGCSRKFAAALFLLTADTRLWHQAENHIGANEIDINAMKPRRLDAMAYGQILRSYELVMEKEMGQREDDMRYLPGDEDAPPAPDEYSPEDDLPFYMGPAM